VAAAKTLPGPRRIQDSTASPATLNDLVSGTGEDRAGERHLSGVESLFVEARELGIMKPPPQHGGQPRFSALSVREDGPADPRVLNDEPLVGRQQVETIAEQV